MCRATDFEREPAKMRRKGCTPPEGYRVNPPYLPAPHKVARAFYTAFTTEPRLPGRAVAARKPRAQHPHDLLGLSASPRSSACRSGFSAARTGSSRGCRSRSSSSSATCRRRRSARSASRCSGIDDGPKIAIIFIGTFFQQVLVIANTVRKVDPALIEAAQTLGARGWQLVRKVIIPGVHLGYLHRHAHPARLGVDLPHRRRGRRHDVAASPFSSTSRRATGTSTTSTPPSS